LLPERDGLQVFMPHEEEWAPYPFDSSIRDAATGEIIYSKPQSGTDVGRGLIADITDLYPGHEYWASDIRRVYNHGAPVSMLRLPINFRIYWDGDLLDELLDGTRITKPDRELTRLNTLTNFRFLAPVRANNGSKNTPCLQADILGDWREEVILRDMRTDSDIYIFTTTIPTTHRLNCLMEDRIYRLAVAAQNVAYNQPPHLGYSPIDTIGD
ncbi:MAG: Por secretion system protein, partial [Duncaniella sp.]|nr:Por secretion system protein [Duncaniella sp.]